MENLWVLQAFVTFWREAKVVGVVCTQIIFCLP